MKNGIFDTTMKTCCICGKKFDGWGNNPEPVKSEGECCDGCNISYVLAARLAGVSIVKVPEEKE